MLLLPERARATSDSPSGRTAASKAAWRWAEAATTSTIFSPGSMRAVAVDRGQPGQRPALGRLLGDAGDLGLGHAGIMLEFERGERAGLVAAQAGEGDDGADVGAGPASAARSRRRCRNPRAGCGRRARRRPSLSRRSSAGRARSRARRRSARDGSTCSWSIATRMTSDGAARRHSLRRAPSASAADRATGRDAGGQRRRSSSARPMRSRTQAK